MKTWKDGLARLGAHVALWAIVVYVASYLCDAVHAAYLNALIIRGLVSVILILYTTLAEMQEYAERKQTAGKTIIDWLAKTSGVVIAFFTAGWWREL